MDPAPDRLEALARLTDELYADPCALWTFLASLLPLRPHLDRFGALAEPDARPVLLHVTGRKDDPRAGDIDTDRDLRGAVDGATSHLEIVPYPAATVADLSTKLVELSQRPDRPLRALQITSHGDRKGHPVLADGEPLGADRLLPIVASARLRLVVLAVCHSKGVAGPLASGVPFVIGLEGEAGDADIPGFCADLYRRLASASIPDAFIGARSVVAARLRPVLAIDRTALITHLAAAHVLDAPFFDALAVAHPNAIAAIAPLRALYLRLPPARDTDPAGQPPRTLDELLALLDRSEAWTALLSACAPRQPPHLFVVTGPHDQDLPLFRERILGHIADRRHALAAPASRAVAASYHNINTSGRARSRADWSARCQRATGQGGKPLSEALAAFAAAGPSILLLDLIGDLDRQALDVFLDFVEQDLLPAVEHTNAVAGRGPLHLVVLAHETPPPSGLGRLLARLAALFGRDRADHAKREALDTLRLLARKHGLTTPSLAPLRCPTWAELEAQYTLTDPQKAACRAACEPLIQRGASLREVCEAFYRALYPQDPHGTT